MVTPLYKTFIIKLMAPKISFKKNTYWITFHATLVRIGQKGIR